MTPNIVPTKFTADDFLSSKLKMMSRNVNDFAKSASEKFSRAGKSAFNVGKKAAITAAVVAAPLILMAKSAVEYEDKLADIGKTTGLAGPALNKLGDDILKLSTTTRSSVDDIATITEIGGRLGIAQKDLFGFTQEANKFAVALGYDFSGGVESAITEFGKLKNLFKDTKDLDVSQSLLKSGSAFNALSAKGVNVEGLTDFSLRVGALPEVLRPTLASSAALGATLQKSGVDAQIAASGFSNFVTIAGQNLPAFAKQMGISAAEAQKLYNSDSATFFAQFSASLKGVPADQLAVKLKSLRLNSLEVQKAVGGLSGAQETYAELLKISNDQMKLGTSIGEEYNTKNSNTAASLAKATNTAKALSIKLGTALLPIVNQLLQSITPLVQSAADWVSRNKALTGTIVKVAAGVAVAAAGVSALSFAVGTVQKGTALANIALKAFGSTATLSAGPIGLIAAGVAAATYVIYQFTKANEAAATSQEIAADISRKAFEQSRSSRAELTLQFGTLRRAKQGTEEFKNALSAINSIQPGIIEKYNLQAGAIKNLASYQTALNAAERESLEISLEKAKGASERESAQQKVTEAMRLREEGIGFWESLWQKDEWGVAENRAKNLENQAKVGFNRASFSDQRVSELETSSPAAPANPAMQLNQKQQIDINITGLPDGVTATQNTTGSNNGRLVPVMPKSR